MTKKSNSEDLLERLDDEKIENYKMRIYQLNQFNISDMENVIGLSIISELLLDILQELREVKKLLKKDD